MGGLTLTGHHRWITELAFSPDSRWLVTAGFDKTILLWDLHSSKLASDPMVLPEVTISDGFVHHVFFTNDMHWLITIVDNRIHLWDIRSGIPDSSSTRLTTDIDYSQYPAAVSPNSRWLAVARSDPDGILLWDLMATDIPASRIELSGYSRFNPAIMFSADSRWLIGSGEDDNVRLVDLDAPSPSDRSFILPNTQGAFSEISLSPDGGWLKTMSSGGIRLWNLRNEDPIQSPIEPKLGTVLRTLEFSSDGRRLAGATVSGTVLLWMLDETGRISQSPEALENPRNSVSHLSFSPDNRWLAGFDNEGPVQLWNLRAADDFQPTQITLRHDGGLESVVFSPDGQWMTVRDEHHLVHLWDLRPGVIDGAPIELEGFDTERIENLSFSQDSQWLVASSSGRIAPDYENGTVRLWNLQQRDFHVEPTQLQAHPGPVTKAILDANERWLITGGEWPDATVRLWDAGSINPLSLPHVLTRHEGTIEIIEVSGDNRWLATYGAPNPETGDYVGAPLRLWDLTTKDPWTKEPIALKGDTAQMTGVVFSEDGQWMVSLGEKPTIWNLRAILQDPEPILLGGHNGPVWTAAFSHDGRWLITGGSDRTVRMWDLTANNPSDTSEILGRHNRVGDIGVIAISPDDQWVVTGEGFRNYCTDCEAEIWNLGDGGSVNRLRATLVGHTAPIKQIIVTSDSQRAITVSEDSTARIWDVSATGTVTDSIVLRGHTGAIVSAVLSADNRWLVTDSKDGTARVWDLAASDPNQRSITLNGHEGGITAVLIRAANHTIITAGTDGTIRTWSLRAEDLIERACSVVGRNLQREEWAQYFPGEAYRQTCENLPNGPTADELLSPIGKVLQIAEGGDIKNAVAGFDEALALNPKAEISADDWNALCWAGATWNQATLVLDACDAAVKLAPDSFDIHDSRGLARALTGDVQGAIEDFEFALERAKAARWDEEFIAPRTAWVKALREGKDPQVIFDAVTLEGLR
jgi:WD40 repeat protein